MQFTIISLIAAAATLVAGSPLTPYSYGPVCTDGTVAVCCETSYGEAVYDTCVVAGHPKRVKAFEHKCATLYGELDAYCCTDSYGKYSDCTAE